MLRGDLYAYGSRDNLRTINSDKTCLDVYGKTLYLYYPQVFYGYWVSVDPDAEPDYGDEREWDLPKYEPSTTPIFLPKTVDARRVRAGYPLGKTGDQYYRCSGESEAEEAGYYFVDHPTGAYCEKIR